MTVEGFPFGPGERSITLRHSPDSAGVARRFVHDALRDLGRLEIETDALLCVSELVANAVRYSSGTCVVVLSDVGGSIRLEVHDTSGVVPKLVNPPLATSGRGLAIVAALAARWGIDVRRADGKSVWCQLEGPEPGGSPRPGTVTSF